MVIYAVGTTVMVGVLPATELRGSLTPVADTALLLGGRAGAIVLTVAAIVAFFSVANAGILSASRYPLAMSRDHLLPRQFRRVGSRRTPTAAIILTVLLIAICVTVFDPAGIAKLASSFQLLLFASNCLAGFCSRWATITEASQ